MSKGNLTKLIVLGGICAGSFAAGYYKGSADSKGINLSGLSDIGLLCAPPIVSSIVCATVEDRFSTRNHDVVGAIFGTLDVFAAFVGGGIGACVFEGAGYATGYLTNYLGGN